MCIRNVATLSRIGALGLAAALAGCSTPPTPPPPAPACPSLTTATPAQAQAALAYLRKKLPNTQFTQAVPSRAAPGLVRLSEVGTSAPVYFDPRTRYLIIGLVVDFGSKEMRIAGGKSMLGAGHMAIPAKGAS